MDGVPVVLAPEGTLLPLLALGSSGAIYRDSSNQDQVIKTPIKHNLHGCSERVIRVTKNDEYFSALSIDREKLIYQSLPKDPNILECLAITEKGLHFPWVPLGNLRDYMQDQRNLDPDIRDRWIHNAVDAIAVLHSNGVIHADISARNFLVTDDLSIKLCDFGGSAINDLDPLTEEEDQYRLLPQSSRTFQTDLFALGCLIFEISTGARPYDEFDDSQSEEIERRYAAQIFPDLDGLKYRSIIYKCWTCHYTSVDILCHDLEQLARNSAFSDA